MTLSWLALCALMLLALWLVGVLVSMCRAYLRSGPGPGSRHPL